MTTATRRVQFCAGHRVYGHESKCAYPHGHNYVAFFTAIKVDTPLDDVGRVIDFSALKERLGGWIEENWDHKFLVWSEDVPLLRAFEMLPQSQVFVLPWNPTAENMARWLLEISHDLLAGTGVRLVSVRVWETENCYAEVHA